jgi:hypothetical protein
MMSMVYFCISSEMLCGKFGGWCLNSIYRVADNRNHDMPHRPDDVGCLLFSVKVKWEY